MADQKKATGAMSEGDIKVILDRIDRMDERLSKGIASLAKGQETMSAGRTLFPRDPFDIRRSWRVR